jgi:hypothetical protein
MKQLVTAGTSGISISFHFIWVALVMLTSLEARSQGCVMTCPPNDPPVPINLSSACTDVLTYGQLGVTLSGCAGPVSVDIIVNGNSIGDVITASMIGGIYMVIVTDENSGQSCMTMIKVNDKQAPILTCPPDVTLDCTTDLAEYSALEPGDISDCSGTQVFIEDSVIFSSNCQGPIISKYYRQYIVVDDYLNADTCVQIISLAKASLDNVEFPPDVSGFDALSCFPFPDTSPENTGYPSVNGNDIVNGVFCNLSATYSDVTAAICSGSYKIIRTWTVIDWCNNNLSSTDLQVIEVLDHTPPIVVAPADFTISTSAQNCTADVIMPPAATSDDCSNVTAVRMSGPFGTIFSNGGLIAGLPVGVHRIIYIATTDCQLEGRDTTYVSVQDLQPPVPICNQAITVPVDNSGIAAIPAYIFNSASYDNCGSVYFKVKRMAAPVGYSCANPGNPNNLFDDQVQFCCGDIAHNPIMVIMRVYDVLPVSGPVSDTYLQGHFNDCMVSVTVQDKLPPQIICPSDLTVSCQFPYTPQNLNVFGKVVLAEADREQICIDDPGVPGNQGIQCIGIDGLATDNCHVTIASEASININNCGTGTITRTFTATDDGGLTATCVQTITVINYDPFSVEDITWPSDLTTFNICEVNLLDPEDLDPPYNEPILNDGPCDLAGFTYHDDVFDFSSGSQACFKILRTWKVIDWCQYVPPYSGVWTHIQVIKVMNNVPPVIVALEDITECSFDPNCGGLNLDFEAQASDDCSNPNSLTWKYYIDLNNNQSFDFTSPEITGGSISFSYEFPIGHHRILYTVWDGCGNISTVEQQVTVESCKPPSAKCIHGLSTNLMAMDMNGDGQADWGMVVLQAQMFDGGSSQACGNPFSLAFSEDPLDVTRIFDCGNLGENEVELWAIDQNGLTDFCLTTVDIQDNNHICPPGTLQTGSISGNISVPNSGKLSGAMVYLDGSNQSGFPSSTDGYFVFPAMPFGGEYTVRPVREGDAKNGVTTLDLVQIQKHLLGIKTFTNPYQYIAADANNSKSVTAIDIVQLRKLILGFYNELPNNKSWRFINKSHIFPDPNNPWSTAWPEDYKIAPFSNSMNGVDFDAVKIGDINLNANLQAGNGLVLPRGSKKCTLEYDVQATSENGVYRVDLYLPDAEKYEAIQFAFDWDQKGYSLVDWSPGQSLTSEDIRMPEHPGDAASLAAFTTVGWPSGKMPLVSLWVRSNSPQPYPFQLFLKPVPTSPVAYEMQSDDEVAVQLGKNNSAIELLQNRPNPFRDMTTIIMQSDRAEKATLRIFDLNGKLIHSRDIMLEVGENEFIVNKSDLNAAGIYGYEIESNFQYRTNRMIIVD